AQLLFVLAGHIVGSRARRLLREAFEALPEPSRSGHADGLARLEAEDERERRLREELTEAERALAKAQQDLDVARLEGEPVTAEPPREAHARLREAGMVGQ